MSLIVPNEGEAKLLSVAFGKDASENFILKLYTNDYTPVETSTASSFTEPSTFGYSAKTVVASDWTVVEGAPSAATATEQVFSFTGALGAVYGYFVVGAVSGVVYWAERFTYAPITIQNNGDQIRITLQLGLD